MMRPMAAERRDEIAVAIMAKAPRAGEVKRASARRSACRGGRALPLLPAGQSRADAGRGGGDAGDRVHAPGGPRGVQEARAGLPASAPRGPNLGCRLSNAFSDLLGRECAGTVMIDGDTPALPLAYLQEAVDAPLAGGRDGGLGPSEDGGYYLIGLRAPRPALFEDMPWGTLEVLPETLRRARALGCAWPCCRPGSTWTTRMISSGCATPWRARRAGGAPHLRLPRRMAGGGAR